MILMVPSLPPKVAIFTIWSKRLAFSYFLNQSVTSWNFRQNVGSFKQKLMVPSLPPKVAIFAIWSKRLAFSYFLNQSYELEF